MRQNMVILKFAVKKKKKTITWRVYRDNPPRTIKALTINNFESLTTDSKLQLTHNSAERKNMDKYQF